MAGIPEVGEVFGPYRLTGVLGRGGMGVVFAARDSRIDRAVALKVLGPALSEDDEFRSRFAREESALVSLNSLHAVQLFEYGEQDGSLYLAAQLIEGVDLATHVRSNGALPAVTAISVINQLCEALTDAHDLGVMHRNLKPSNVLVRDHGTVLYAYLCDFGIAATDDVVNSGAGPLAGYKAPELHDGVGADVRSDIYSMGCLLWFALTGRAPYEGTDVQVALAHLGDPVVQFDGEDPATARLNDVLARLMAKAPRDRFGSISEFAATLAAVGPVSVTAPSLVEPVETVEPVEPLAPDPSVEPEESDEPVARLSRRQRRKAERAAAHDPVEPDPDDKPEDEPQEAEDSSGPELHHNLHLPQFRRPDVSWVIPGALMLVVPVVALAVVLAVAKNHSNGQGTTSPPMTVTAGQAFTLDAFKISSGWQVGPSGATLGLSQVQVTNTSATPDTAHFTISLYAGSKKLDVFDCRTGLVAPKEAQPASCAGSDSVSPRATWDTVTVQPAF